MDHEVNWNKPLKWGILYEPQELQYQLRLLALLASLAEACGCFS